MKCSPVLMTFGASFLIFGTVFASPKPGGAVPGGFNHQFQYGETCLRELDHGKKEMAKSREGSEHVKKLSNDLGDLDAQLRIVTNSNEDIDFRQQVMTTAERTRQVAIYTLNELANLDSSLASRLSRGCLLEKIRENLDWGDALFNELFGLD